MSNIQWTPLGTIPRNSGSYSAGKTVTGIPYSSVKQLDKFVGFEVSFYTFMSAVNNPRSVLYTENVGKPPYNGDNCATYYGTVCSAAVGYALGLDYPWQTFDIDEMSCFKRTREQDPRQLRISDVLWKSGHEVMVYDITKDVHMDTITNVTILESNSGGTRLRAYSIEKMIERINKDKFKIYRYTPKENRQYVSCAFITDDGSTQIPFNYNNVLCCCRGDRAVFREGEEVIINIFDNTFDKLSVYKDGEFIYDVSVEIADVHLSNLKCGRYAVYAENTGSLIRSEPTEFDVLDTDIEVTYTGGSIDITINNKYGTPVYACVCDKQGLRKIVKKLTTNETATNHVVITTSRDMSAYYCKIYFETDWGRVTNEPIHLSDVCKSQYSEIKN